jgi:intracellular sulfur oxidation DsrE/DsrF family protein
LSTVYGFTNDVWVKYGKILGNFLKLEGDVSANPMLKKGDKGAAPPITALVDDGVQYAICAAATKFMAGMLAKEAGEDAKDVEEYLHANAIPGGRFVPAGVVAIDRAQQRGYSFSYVQG